MRSPPPAVDAAGGQDRDPALDGLRGLAIVAVMAFHFFRYADWAGSRWFRAGWCGVDLFFVLSGYLITGILLETRTRKHYARSFYGRRVLRIFPVYYTFLFVIWLGHLLGFAAEAPTVWHWAYVSNLHAAARGRWLASPALNPPWSLAIEEQFYLVWPLVVRLCRRRTLLAVAGIVMVMSAVCRLLLLAEGANPITIYALSITRLDGLALGALIALAARGEGGLGQWRRAALWLVAALPAVAVLTAELDAVPVFDEMGPTMQGLGFSLVALFWGSVLVCTLTASPGSPVRHLFEGKTLRSLGRYSFALYLVHDPIGWAVAEALGVVGVRPAPLGRVLATIAIAAGASVGVALASWHLIERRCLALKRHFPYPTPAAPEPAVRSP